MQPIAAAQHHLPAKDPRLNLYGPILLLLAAILLLLSLSFSSSPSPSPSRSNPLPISSSPPPPSLAYLLSGSDGDASRLLRLLHAVYHPRNLYVLHLDLAASRDQRLRLARSVQSVPTFRRHGNVHVIGRPGRADPRGSSTIAVVLHGAALLLRISDGWSWFLNLHASDYPLVSQDDLLHVFSVLPEDLNFVQHTSNLTWRETHRLKPIIVDPGLHLSSKADVFYTSEKRQLPNAFRVFTGSASVILSRKFIEHCILGTDNLPRTLLMYYANTPSSHRNYFQTVLCNSPAFNRTIVNHHLHYEIWDTPPKRDPRMLNLKDYENMTQSGAAFATQIPKDDPVLKRIDEEVLNRAPGRITPGGWCLGIGDTDPCSVSGNSDIVRPSLRAVNLTKTIEVLLSDGKFLSNQCIWE
ncbi:LOW QUALITY PROTEIN: beta-glucuronosyltransferase GlcAT14A-like [Dioscorea cayenensis subsp. rotundata]|uniref:LOW QUALITY PROTEIN: beta-glucuronosyltransferase GlcAT14A-like n=1 Tax=Dioscorea cayennensis subsp. rotundata TaxID=55577 RepID=A0AB40C018_DIOCR|nr:LOW QUALITY PROTEIN: beta-glucuronosyltransferase GlcAT14A-like [Dioscorea cayenensis subsp. rotundata]